MSSDIKDRADIFFLDYDALVTECCGLPQL